MRVNGPQEYEAAMKWLRSSDKGVSSETIWRILMEETPDRMDIPYDPDDFGRCYRLLAAVPSWRGRLDYVAMVCKKWKPFVAAWDELTALYEAGVSVNWEPPYTMYARMCELRGEPLSAAEIEHMNRPRVKKRARR